jgi:hypothetical protein
VGDRQLASEGAVGSGGLPTVQQGIFSGSPANSVPGGVVLLSRITKRSLNSHPWCSPSCLLACSPSFRMRCRFCAWCRPLIMRLVEAVSDPCSAGCPTCGSRSWRVHSHYPRTLRDFPSHGRPVTIHVTARRFRCLNSACTRKTFAERLDDAAVYARQTKRLGDLQRHLALALGGEAGTRLAARLAVPISADTSLRMAATTTSSENARSTPRVLAVDDWAWRRGHRYGTILVDLERNDVVSLLPDRQAETLAAWRRRSRCCRVSACRSSAGRQPDRRRGGRAGCRRSQAHT